MRAPSGLVSLWRGALCALLAIGLVAPQSYAAQAPANDPLAIRGAYDPTSAPAQPVVGRQFMVVSAHKLASDVGAQILSQGGNAADAAVAVAYALAVVYPAAGNIGGGGFITLRHPSGKVQFIDFRERAPLAATATMYQDQHGRVIPGLSEQGWKAVATPGTVAGLEELLKRWGRLPRQRVMAPAIGLARQGFVLGRGDVALLNTSTRELAKDIYARAIFRRPDGTPLQVGDRLVQKDLGRTLSLIALEGPKVFYQGEIAKEIVRASREGRGLLTQADFTQYQARLREPLQCRYRGLAVYTAPPPSGGGVALCEMLSLLEGYDLRALGLHSTAAVQRQVEAMRRAYADRQDLGDPDFVKNPVRHLLDPAYIRQAREAIPPDRALASGRLRAGQPAPEKPQTTHFSVIDKDGFAVSVTFTLNGWFGARVVAGHTGIVMNDEMDDFSTRPGAPNMFGIIGSKANAIAPGKRPLSSMAPTILARDGKVFMVVGSPGGSRIPTIILSVITGVVDYGLNIQQAINLPRFHEQWQPSKVQVEQHALSDDVRQALQREGYEIAPHAPWGVAEGIVALTDPKGRVIYYGGVDHRHEGGGAAAQ